MNFTGTTTGGAAKIGAAASHAAFGRPLITNVFRGLIAEAIVGDALGSEWEWCSHDYSAWDFQRGDGRRLEVKQSASRQSWAEDDAPSSKCSFDIRVRQGRLEGALWIEQQRRWADVYVFAHHPGTGPETDHREPSQWLFYVVKTDQLPMQKTIALARVAQLTAACSQTHLSELVTLALS